MGFTCMNIGNRAVESDNLLVTSPKYLIVKVTVSPSPLLTNRKYICLPLIVAVRPVYPLQHSSKILAPPVEAEIKTFT